MPCQGFAEWVSSSLIEVSILRKAVQGAPAVGLKALILMGLLAFGSWTAGSDLALAQNPPAAQQQTLPAAEAWPAKLQALSSESKNTLDSLSARASAKDVDDMKLAELKSQTDDLTEKLNGHLDALKQRLDQVQARIKELGDPPQDGQPPEAQVVTDERNRLLSERAEMTAASSELGQIAGAARDLASRITEQRRRLFSDTLLKHTDLSWGLLTDAASTLGEEAHAFGQTMSGWVAFAWKFKKLQLLAAVFLSIGAALLFLAGGYRMLGKMVTRDRSLDNPPYITRLSFAFWTLVVQTFSLTAFLSSTFFFLNSFGVLRPDIAPLIGSFLGLIWGVLFVGRLSYLVLAPDYPNWRLIRLSNRGARILSALFFLMAVTHGLDYTLTEISEALNSPVALSIAKSVVASVVIGALIIVMSFLKPSLAENKDPDAPGAPWPRWLAISLRLLGVALILCVLAGYIGLARFVSTQIVLTGALIVTGYIGVLSGRAVGKQGAFAQTAVGRFVAQKHNLNEIMLDQIGLVAGLSLYVFSAVLVVPVILLTWGFQIQDIEAGLVRLFTQISIGNISISLVGILVGVLLFLGGYLFTRFSQRWIDRHVMARSHVDAGVRNSVKTGIGYLGTGVAIVMGVSAAGINLSSLALVASALSVGIGFGLQNIVSNFVSGLILLVERPFKVGDHIVTGTTEGIVKRISVRATEIETFRKQSIIVPNSELINASVGNWTHRNRVQRSEIPIGVGYDSDPRQVISILMDIAMTHPEILHNPEPHVDFVGFGASSLDFELRFHVSDISNGIATRADVRCAILQRFKEAGIEIPFPHQDIKIRGPVFTAPYDPAADRQEKPSPDEEPASDEAVTAGEMSSVAPKL